MLSVHSSLMKPGWYSFDGQIVSLTGSNGLINLKEAKGYPVDPLRHIITRFLIRTAYWLIPPCLKYLSRQGGGSGTQLLVTAQGNVKIFDFFSQTVSTIFQNSNDAALLLSNRKRLSPSLYMINIQPHPLIEMATVEPICEGTCFSDVDSVVQSDIFRSIIGSYASFFCSKHPSYNNRGHFDNLFSTALQLPLPLKIKDAIINHRDRLIDKLVTYPFYDCHGDLHGKNIIIANQKVTILDLETVYTQPFFYDLISIIYHEALTGRMTMMDDMLEGVYNHDIKKMTDMNAIVFETKHIHTFLLYFLYKITQNPCSHSTVITDRELLANIARPILMRLEKLSCSETVD